MKPHDSLHVILGTDPLGLSTLQHLRTSGLWFCMVNRSGHAELPEGTELRACDARNAAAARAAAADATAPIRADRRAA